MKTEAIRLCIQAQYGKKDYSEAREELNALLARITELEAAQKSVQRTCTTCGSDEFGFEEDSDVEVCVICGAIR